MNSNTRSKKLSINKALQLLAVSLMATLGLSGCGSSGGGGSTPAPATPTLTVAAASVAEGTTGETPTVDFVLTLSPAASSDVTVTYSTSDNTATATNPNADYTASSSDTLVIPAGQTSATVSITVMGDIFLEFDETFNLLINSAPGTTIGSQSVVGTILSDDSLAGYYTGDSSIIETTGNAAVDRTNNIKVIADINRLSIIDLTNNFVYIATINAYTSQTAFTATARIYENGNYTRMTTISGVINGDKSLDLTLDGTSSGGGDFTGGTIALSYSTKNGEAALVFASGDTWSDAAPFTAGFVLNLDLTISITLDNDLTNVPSTSLVGCRADPVTFNNVLSEEIEASRIRSFSVSSVTICAATLPLEGYITTYDSIGGTADDTVLFIWFNDNGVHAAALQ